MTDPILNALSVDVEDYYQVSAFERHVPRERWEWYPSRVVTNTQRLLELLDRHRVKATFFVLGWTARAYPDLVREIDAAGHELGSHSYWHRLVYEQDPEEFRADLIDSRSAIEDAVGRRVVMYRAPSFSIRGDSLWALDILAEEGFEIDSSIFPIHHDRYGLPDAEPKIHRIQLEGGALWEFPPPVARVGRWNVPVTGGGYFRLYPLSLTCRALGYMNVRQRRPFVFYCHPWEIDPEQPRIHGVGRRSRFRHYVNLRSTYRKFEQLLCHFRFGTLTDVIRTQTDTAPTITLPNNHPYVEDVTFHSPGSAKRHPGYRNRAQSDTRNGLHKPMAGTSFV